VPVLLFKFYCTDQNGHLILLDDPSRVRSKITSVVTVVCQISIQPFDFYCNLVVTRKSNTKYYLVLGIPPAGLGINPLINKGNTIVDSP
jgi:hypothetical protein